MTQKGWHYFLKCCLAAENDKELSELLNLFLTHEEKSSIETRCLIIKALLEKKNTQRDMANDLHVSIAKITRGSNELKRISPRLWDYLQKHLLSQS
jgi:TrpR family trp operon transcriptional repressor